MAAYLEALEAHNEAAKGEKPAPPVSDWLKNRVKMEGADVRH